MSKLLIGESLRYGQADTPTREGEVINYLEEIYNIPTPFVGMRVYCKQTGKAYTITSLASEIIGGEEVFNKVGTFRAEVKDVTWVNVGNVSNMNDFTEAGVYDIKGERTRIDDNLPILNTGGGHSFNARLTVLDSSIAPAGKSDDICITQKLTLSNRVAGDGDVYIRTGRGTSKETIKWESWGKLQQNIEVGSVTTLDDFIDNGIYSGVYVGTGSKFTFVMVVINDYALAAKLGADRVVNQFLYAVEVGGHTRYTTRQKIGGAPWGGEEILNEKEITSMIEAEIKKVNDRISTLIDDNDPDTLDSIKDLIDWVNAHGADAAAMLMNIQQNTVKINAEISRAQAKEKELSDAINSNSEAIGLNYKDINHEVERATQAESDIKANAMQYNTLDVNIYADKTEIYGRSINTDVRVVEFPAATETTAGVMTASDKSKLNNLAKRGDSCDLDTYTSSGVYLIQTDSNEVKNYPIQTPANSVLRLTVIDSYDGNNHVITQVLNINNFVGGEGNIYIRSNQNQTWKPWAKLQTNVEVGLISQTQMDDLTDNGIYSGILSTTGETFVIICINNYDIAQQVGVHHISHLKYSLVVGTGEVKIEKRTRDAYGFWTDWEDVAGGGSVTIEVTYSTLLNLRDTESLIPGMKYRITDYITTTAQENTVSAGNPFDIIVTADTINSLNENAAACQNKDDGYFDDTNFSAWELKYCLDNDTSRFAWADAENGKGVIYHMKDEHNNECAYDFKNIMFVRYKLNAPTVGGYFYEWQNRMSENINKMFEGNLLSYLWHGVSDEYDYYWEDDMGEVISSPTGETKAFFTFSNVVNDIVTDKSKTSVCYSNIIKESRNGVQLVLNNIVFFSIDITNYCYYNSFGNYCYYNSFGNDCNSNSFGNDCNYNSFGNYCNYNSFGNYCYYNSFGNDCNYNSFGNDCYYNSFGNYCNSNSFGNYCKHNGFFDDSSYVFDDNKYEYLCDGSPLDYVQNNKFGDGCSHLLIYNVGKVGPDESIQNLNIAQGFSSISIDTAHGVFYPEVIEIDTVGQDYEIKIARNSKGEVRIYCEADLVV